MKQNLRLFMLTLLCAVFSNVWGQEVTIASFSPSNTDGWTITNAEYASAGGGYYKLFSGASIVSPDIDWSQYTDITITISARKYNGPNETQGKISVSQGETELASYSPSSTSIVASGALDIEPEDGPITISCPGASDSKGCGVQSITIKGKSDKSPIATLNSISPEALTVGETGSFTLSANFAEGATYTVEWSSNNSTILSVNENGSYEALSAGTANVTVTVKPNDTNSYLEASKSFAVTVNAAPVTFDFPWSEDFSSNSLEGYTVANGGTNTKLYNENNAGGEAPELLLSNSGGKFEVTIKLNGNYGAMTLTFKANNDRVTVAATGGTLGDVSFSNKSYTIPVTVEEGTETLKLTFSNTTTNNVRVDDFKLEKSKAKPGIYFAEESVTVQPNDTEFTGLTLNNPNHLTVTYSSSDVSLASVNETTGVVTIGENEGIVIITATFAGDEEFEAGTASYTINIGEEKGTLERPYTVAEARAAIDANTGVTGVYATGIVSKIVTKYNSQYGNISYNISADGLTSGDQLQAYRGKSYNGANFTSEDDIQVGDVVVVYGNLIKYNTTYEFAEGNQLVSLFREPSVLVNTTEVNVEAEGGDGTITVTYKNFEDTEIEADIAFYAADGETSSTYDWVTASIDSDNNNVSYTVAANSGEARTAYLKVYALDGKGDNVFSDLITITQSAAPKSYTLTITPNDNAEIFAFYEDNQTETIISGSEVQEGSNILLSIAVNSGYRLTALNVVDTENNVINLTDNNDETYTFTMPSSNVTISCTVEEQVITTGGFELVTDASTLMAGQEIILVGNNGSTYMAMSTTQKSNNRESIEVTLNSDGTITPSSSVQIITLEGRAPEENDANTGWYLNVADHYLYAPSTSNNHMKTTEDDVKNKTSRIVTLSIDQNGLATIKADQSNKNLLAVNFGSSKVFSFYSNTNTNTPILLPYIYRRPGATETVTFAQAAEGYSTLYYGEENLQIAAKTKAYTYNVGDDGNSVETEYENVIPKGSAVVVELEDKDMLKAGDYPVTFYRLEETTETAHTDNMLYGFDEDGNMTVGPDETKEYLFYSLSLNKKKEKGSIGFYWNQPDGAAFEMPAHRAYLAVEKTDANQGVSVFTFDGMGTGINGIYTNGLPADGVYTLTGVRVNSECLQKGIYIVNGKKVVIK